MGNIVGNENYTPLLRVLRIKERILRISSIKDIWSIWIFENIEDVWKGYIRETGCIYIYMLKLTGTSLPVRRF